MKTNWQILGVLGVTLGLAASGGAVQENPAPSPPKDVVETRMDAGEVVRIGGDYVLPAGQRVESVLIVSGTARIEGEVEQELVVVAGTAILAGTARVGEDVVVAAGAVEVQPGAVVGGDLVVVGGGLKVPPGFAPGGDQVSLGAFPSAGRVATAVPSCACSSIWCSMGPCEPAPAPSAGSP